MGMQTFSLNPFAASALEGGGCSTPRLSALPSVKDLVLVVQEVWWSGLAQKISSPREFDPWGIHPTAHHYSDCAVPTANCCV